VTTGLSWNLLHDLNQLLAYHFMVNALLAGTAVAVGAGLLGWFMVLRRQTFAGHALANVAFPGAAAAAWAGIAVGWGYFGACVIAALVIAATGRGGRLQQESAATGTVLAFALAAGLLFVSLYHGFLGGVNSLLFGSFLGITDTQVWVLAAVSGGIALLLGLFGRPLLYASIDPLVARSAGVPVRALDVAFLTLLGLAAAEASQITGVLLVFALLVMPAAAAQRLTPRAAPGLLLTVVIGLLATWFGLAASYFSDEPVGFSISTIAFATYLLSPLPAAWRRRGAGCRGLLDQPRAA
jgi:zinc/manganese transport system permease protein